MLRLPISHDTAEFEVAVDLDKSGILAKDKVKQACHILDKQGFVILTDLLTEEESTNGLNLVTEQLADPDRERSDFASQVDIQYVRRDFCPLPSTKPILSFSSLVCKRISTILLEHTGASRPVLEISTLTSYEGSSHQYLHRDPEGIISVLVAVDTINEQQGGTLLVPGTHPYLGSDYEHDGLATLYMHHFQKMVNTRIFAYNFAKLRRIMKTQQPSMSAQEYRRRMYYSPSLHDDHQPNLFNFLLGRNSYFDLTNFNPLELIRIFRHKRAARKAYKLIQVCPSRGSVIIYRSDMLHAGPDNCSTRPRYFFNINIAREMVHPVYGEEGYSSHSTLKENPLCLDDLIK